MKRKMSVVSLSAAVICMGSIVWMAYGDNAKGSSYVGTNKCQACHFKEFKTWQKMKHSQVFSVLQDDEKQNPECIKCHATGYGQPGGFVSSEKTPALENVGCEACHGPGSAHIEAAKNAGEGEWEKHINKTPQTCANCHNPHVNMKEQAEKVRAEKKK